MFVGCDRIGEGEWGLLSMLNSYGTKHFVPLTQVKKQLTRQS